MATMDGGAVDDESEGLSLAGMEGALPEDELEGGDEEAESADELSDVDDAAIDAAFSALGVEAFAPRRLGVIGADVDAAAADDDDDEDEGDKHAEYDSYGGGGVGGGGGGGGGGKAARAVARVGDAHTGSAAVGSAAANSIRSSERKAETARNVGLSREGRATAEGVLDPRTRMILFKLLSAGHIASIHGCISTGKVSARPRAAGSARAPERWRVSRPRVERAERLRLGLRAREPVLNGAPRQAEPCAAPQRRARASRPQGLRWRVAGLERSERGPARSPTAAAADARSAARPRALPVSRRFSFPIF
jgi:hypothetical protein